jgi:hypothetical protein
LDTTHRVAIEYAVHHSEWKNMGCIIFFQVGDKINKCDEFESYYKN